MQWQCTQNWCIWSRKLKVKQIYWRNILSLLKKIDSILSTVYCLKLQLMIKTLPWWFQILEESHLAQNLLKSTILWELPLPRTANHHQHSCFLPSSSLFWLSCSFLSTLHPDRCFIFFSGGEALLNITDVYASSSLQKYTRLCHSEALKTKWRHCR